MILSDVNGYVGVVSCTAPTPVVFRVLPVIVAPVVPAFTIQSNLWFGWLHY